MDGMQQEEPVEKWDGLISSHHLRSMLDIIRFGLYG